MPSRKHNRRNGGGSSANNSSNSSSTGLPLHVDTAAAARPTERTPFIMPVAPPSMHAAHSHSGGGGGGRGTPFLLGREDLLMFGDDDDDDHITEEGSIAQLKEHIGTSIHVAPGAEPGWGDAAGGLASQLRPLFHAPYLPFLTYGRRYLDEDVYADVIAGVVVSIVAIPQGLAYSLLASLPPATGLYTSLVPPMVYGLLGTSRQLSAGPVAIVSMFIPTIAAQMHMQRDPNLRVAVASMSCIVSGLLLMMLGLFKLGGLVRFISSPVLTGR